MGDEQKPDRKTVLERMLDALVGELPRRSRLPRETTTPPDSLPQSLRDLTGMAATLGEDCLEPGAAVHPLWNAWFDTDDEE